jgi:hypothetical protein
MLLVLIFFMGWANPMAQCSLKDLVDRKNALISSSLEPMTYRFIA